MKAKGSSNRAVNMQATAAAKNTSNQQATTAEQATKKILPGRICSPRKPAVTGELAEEEGDQTPYFNPFQR
jgi:hypothetical protein